MRTIPTCHPNKPHKAKGLCSSCYNAQLKKQKPEHFAKYHADYREVNRLPIREKEKLRYHTDPEKQRAYSYRKSYGMSLKDVQNMLVSQDFSCAICTKYIDENTKHIDHCHSTGFVRGLLCPTCNHGLGKLGDTREGLLRALAYLDRPLTQFRPT